VGYPTSKKVDQRVRRGERGRRSRARQRDARGAGPGVGARPVGTADRL